MVLKKRVVKGTHFKIRINEDELAELQALAADLDVSLAELFREGARQLANKEKRRLRGLRNVYERTLQNN